MSNRVSFALPLVVGVTGGIASGKTKVADLFATHFEVPVIDADIIARQVVAKGTPALMQLRQYYGAQILTATGELNRPVLRQLIFENPHFKHTLEALLHPIILAKIHQALAQVSAPYVLVVVPLLIESQWQSLVDRILVVDVLPETQIKRTQLRDQVSKQQAAAIVSAQASREQRLSYADDVIKNEAENADLLPQITLLHEKYLAMSAKNRGE